MESYPIHLSTEHKLYIIQHLLLYMLDAEINVIKAYVLKGILTSNALAEYRSIIISSNRKYMRHQLNLKCESDSEYVKYSVKLKDIKAL